MFDLCSIGVWLLRVEEKDGVVSSSVANFTKPILHTCLNLSKSIVNKCSELVKACSDLLPSVPVVVEWWTLVCSICARWFTSLLSYLTVLRDVVFSLSGHASYYFVEFINACCLGWWYLVGCLRDVAQGASGFVTYTWTRADERTMHVQDVASPQELFEQHKAIARLSRELKELEHLAGDFITLKQTIEDIKVEIKKEKESGKSAIMSKLEDLEALLSKEKEERIRSDGELADSLHTLQKYQVAVNHALRRCCHRSQPIQLLLHREADKLREWVATNYWTKEEGLMSDQQIASLVASQGELQGEDLQRFKAEFAAFVREHRTAMAALREGPTTTSAPSNGVSVDFVRRLVADAIKLYDADKTGKVDYALESSGGEVLSIRCTETYVASSKQVVLFGWALFSTPSSPRHAISPGVVPGQCWAFVGSQGYLVIQLSHTVLVTGFTVEHVSRHLVPRGHIGSAPRNFSMWGLLNETDPDPYLFGDYTYLDNDETLQYFPVMHVTSRPFKLVEIKITSNHGNPEYTCLYRLRVHGKVYDPEPSTS